MTKELIKSEIARFSRERGDLSRGDSWNKLIQDIVRSPPNLQYEFIKTALDNSFLSLVGQLSRSISLDALFVPSHPYFSFTEEWSNFVSQIAESSDVVKYGCVMMAINFNMIDLASELSKHFTLSRLKCPFGYDHGGGPAYNEVYIIHQSAFMGSIDMVKLIYNQQKEAILIPNDNGVLALHYAALRGDGDEEVFRFFFNPENYPDRKIPDVDTLEDDVGFTPFMMAATKGNIKNAKYLAEECHADVNATDWYGRNVLHLIALDGDLERWKLVRTMFDVDVNEIDAKDRAPLDCVPEDKHDAFAYFEASLIDTVSLAGSIELSDLDA